MTKALGETASITLLTALPGSGKTLRLVTWIKAASERGELVFVSNLNGLKLPHVPFADPREWESLPPGSVLVVDEAQQFFRARRGGDPPPYITAMETIRHKGIRLILATQQPNYLDTHLRGLVGLHEHLVRCNGEEAAKIYRHNEVIEDVRSEKGRARFDSEKWAFPAENYALYESAEVHTVKYRMSARMKRGLIVGALVLGGVGWLGYTVKRDFIDGASVDTAAESARFAAPIGGRAAGEPVGKPRLTAAEYVDQFRPRVPAMPQSAPAYDGRPVVAQPRLFCAASSDGINAQGEHADAGCSCMTEQGTRYQTDSATCQYIARWGEVYDPYRAPPVERPTAREAVGGAGGTPAVDGPTGAAVAVPASESAEPIASYGWFRDQRG